MDIVLLLDENGNKTNQSLVVVMAGVSAMEAYIIDNDNMSQPIYFKKQYDMETKIKTMFTMMDTNIIGRQTS